jgi:hypothetical protein
MSSEVLKIEKKMSLTATAQNWTPRLRRRREVCDFLITSSVPHLPTDQKM